MFRAAVAASRSSLGGQEAVAMNQVTGKNPLPVIDRLLGFPIQLPLVLKHLKQDMRDDWYFDALQYEDIFKDHEYCLKVIESSFNLGHGEYIADTPTVRGIPKKGYSERYALETDFFDRFVYQAAASFLIPVIDPLLSNRVLSYRYDKYPVKSKYLFKNKIDRWGAFEGLTFTFLKDNKYLAVTDLTNFFEGISSEAVCDKMLELLPQAKVSGDIKAYARNAIAVLRRNLHRWTFKSGIGLPQNRDASSFLSNVRLYDVDRAMEDDGLEYFRYVDDIRIICDTEESARRALTTLTRTLREHGFSLNGAKTVVLSKHSSNDELSSIFSGLDSNIAAINSMWKSRSRRVVIRSAQYIMDIISSAVETGQTQSRAFRFAVNRLSRLIQAGLIKHDDDGIKQVRDLLIGSLYDHAASTDQYCRILLAIDPNGDCCEEISKYIVDHNKSIYDWQNYNLWMLLAKHQYKTGDLLERAKVVINELPESGEAAGVLIWLKAVDEKETIAVALDAYLKANFEGEGKCWPYINQRYLLIAANALAPESLEPLIGKQHHKLNRTTSRTSEFIDSKGIPIIAPEMTPLPLLIEDANDYA